MAIKQIFVGDGVTKYTTQDLKKLRNDYFAGKVVYGDTNLLVSAKSSPDMSVNISSGRCSINGAILENSTTYNLIIESNTSSYVRIDAVVACINGSTCDLRVIKGTPSASPIAPNMSSIYIKLAEVTVGVNVTTIQSQNIKDCRFEDGQVSGTPLNQCIIDLQNRVIELENGATQLHSNTYQDNNIIKMERLTEDRVNNIKTNNIYLYLSANYLQSCKVGNYSIVPVSYFYSMGETFSVQANCSCFDRNYLTSGKFGHISFTSPVSGGLTLIIPNNNDDLYDLTVYLTVNGR